MRETAPGGFPAEQRWFEHAGIRVPYFAVADLESLVDRESLLRDPDPVEPPYWAHLWIGAVAVARRIAEAPELVRGLTVLDLGCGIGLPGLVAVAAGGEVTLADREPAALAFVRASLEEAAHPRAATVVEVDFTRDDPPTRYDVVLAAEVVYEPESYAPLARYLDRAVAPNGRLLVTDAFRSDARRFFDALAELGFVGERERRLVWEDGRPHGLFLWTFRRSP